MAWSDLVGRDMECVVVKGTVAANVADIPQSYFTNLGIKHFVCVSAGFRVLGIDQPAGTRRITLKAGATTFPTMNIGVKMNVVDGGIRLVSTGAYNGAQAELIIYASKV
jgi:hypothetical protein